MGLEHGDSLAPILLPGASWTPLCPPDPHTQLRTCARFNGQLWIPDAFDRWELIQAQELHGKLRIKENAQRLNSDIGTIAAWLEKTEAELEALRLAEPPSDIQEMALRVKKLQVSGSPAGEEETRADVHFGAEQTDQTWVWCSWQHAANVCREVICFPFSKDRCAGFSLHMEENLLDNRPAEMWLRS